jgi:uncharacterized Ntn-hydrolase superfamily protein
VTFSIAARCAATGRFGIAISSSSPAVAARCAYVRAGVGAVASQNITDPRLGPVALDLMALGASAPAALDVLVARPHIAHRQLLAVDARGRTAGFSGSETLGVHTVAEGQDAVAAGNLLANETIPVAMIAAFARAGGDLGSRLVEALVAGLKAGGEAGPVHSAGLLMAGEEQWPIADLRVDWDDTDPIGKLAALWQAWKPQMDAYVTRALDPAASPSYGVPGDE